MGTVLPADLAQLRFQPEALVVRPLGSIGGRPGHSRRIPIPEVGPGEVRISVQQVGVCGTDLHIHNGDFNAVFPLIPGHELVGVVDTLGDEIERFTVGEQVTVNPNIFCGTCDYCISGRLILCANAKGLGSNYPGFFAEHVTVPANLVFSVQGLPLDTAVLLSPRPAQCTASRR